MIGEGSTILNRFVLVLAASLALGLTGCGGGGGSAGPSSQSISGGGVKGPLANAVVTVYSFDASQSGFKGSVVDDATTDANAGIAGLALPFPIAPPYIMEFTSTSGTTTDITTGQFPVITTMRTVITQSLLDGGEQIYATPLTTMAVDIAISNSNSSTTATEFEAALTTAASQVVSTLGFGLDSSVNIFDTPPLIDSTTDTTEEQTDVAAYRAAVEAVTAIAYEIDQQTAGGDTDSVLTELAADLADGEIDGSAGTEIDTNTLQILQQDPATLTIPNTTQTVADVQAILVSEITTTGTSTDASDLDVGGSITTTPAPAETNPDLDNDGHLNADDAFPTDASEYLDTDGDGTGNTADIDDDNDGWADGANSDDYPLDATLYIDPALNRDGDTILNGVDNCPLTTNEDQVDADNDGLGDVCDPATDTDGDGIANNLDNCPSQANTSQTNTDGDSKGDACDTDIDEDGTNNGVDAFPYDATETTDTDGDGLGDTTADDDDDNDGVVDASDTGVAPAGTSSAGVACSLLIDCDGDGYMDNVDQDPLDPAVTVNFAPVALDGTATTNEDTLSSIVVIDVLASDANVGDSLTITAVSTPSNGTAVINGNNIDYTPSTDFNGTATFTYTVSDSTVSSTGSVTVTITAVNDVPVVGAAGPFSIAENIANAAVVGSVAATDVDSAITGYSIVAGNIGSAFAIDASGQITVADTTAIDYETTINFSLGITATDGTNTSVTETVVVDVNDVNDTAPVVSAAGPFSIAEDDANATVVGSVSATDADGVGAVTGYSIVSGDTGSAFAISAAGQITVADTTAIDYETTISFSLGITATDGTNTSVTETVVVDVNDVNDTAPVVAAGQSFNVIATATNGAVVGTVSATDADTVGSITNYSITGTVFAIAANGQITVADNATLATGSPHTVDVDATDGVNTSASVSVTITAVTNAPPVIAQTGPLSVTMDEDSSPLAFVAPTISATDTTLPADTLTWSTPGAANGVATVSGTGSSPTITYVPNGDFNGGDSFIVNVNDGTSTVGITVNVTVTPVNDAPVALDDSVDTTAEDTLVTTVNVLTNDTDTELDTLNVSSADISSSAGGIVVNNSNGTFDYTPPADFNGIDSFGYTVSDGFLTSVGTVFIDVTPVNDAPVAFNDPEIAIVDVALITGNVLTNDTDVDSGSLTITASDTASANGGTVSDNGNDTFTYTSAAGYVGADSFTYTVSDGLLTAVGTVNITVTPAGTPIAMTTLLGTTEGGLGAFESWTSGAGFNEYEYWTDTYDVGTQTFAWNDFAFNYSIDTFETIGSDPDVALNGSGTWVNEGGVRVVTADNGDGSMTIGIRDAADTVDVEQVKLSARYVDIETQPVADYLPAEWQLAMFDSAAVFGAGAKLISSYTFEMVTDGYLMFSGNWCQTEDPGRYATLNTTATNTNCNGIDVPTGVDASGFATSLSQLEIATPFVDTDDGSTPSVAVHFGWEGSLTLMAELAPGPVNVANYYVVDWSAGVSADVVTLVGTGVYTRDSSVQGVDMINFTPPPAAYTQFPEVMQESSGYLVAMEGGFARLGDYILAGSSNSEMGTVLNGHALDDVLANFDAIQALGYNHIDFTGITAYDLYFDGGVPTWCIDSLAFDGAGGFVQTDYVVCSGTPGSYSGTYSVDATTGVMTITDDVPETFYGKVVGYNETYGAREVCWRLSSTGPWDCTEGDGLSYQFADPTAATTAMNTLNGTSLCDYETADGSYDSYTDFEAVIADCGNEVAVDDATLIGTWVSSWSEADASTTTLTVVYNADYSGTYSEDNSVAGNWDLGTFNWSISAGRVIAMGYGITPGYTDIIVALADGSQKVYAEDTGWGADLVADSNADGVIFTDYLVKQTGSLACGYESGWDELADGGMGSVINPNSFDEYETLLADCHTPWEFTAANVAGGIFVDGTETMTFTLGAAAGTEADRGTGIAVDVDTFNFEWYVEDATCAGCTYQYLVIYADYALNPTLVSPGFWFRETQALININGTPGVADAEYHFMNYAEQSNYSDTDRATGSDAEIWGPSFMTLQ